MAEEEKGGGVSLTDNGGNASGEMSFWEHLEELRSTLAICLVSFAGAGTLALVFSKPIFEILR
ncbi:MAG: hypothetical protein IJF68_04800, partial [Opitutales bacterium]|nr:hypothetical protein [Opitutales bacterium]